MYHHKNKKDHHMKAITDLLDQPLDRKDFLKQVGMGAVMLLGGGLIMRGLSGTQQQSRSRGYGASSYGGR
jgi:hypothetical protein